MLICVRAKANLPTRHQSEQTHLIACGHRRLCCLLSTRRLLLLRCGTRVIAPNCSIRDPGTSLSSCGCSPCLSSCRHNTHCRDE